MDVIPVDVSMLPTSTIWRLKGGDLYFAKWSGLQMNLFMNKLIHMITPDKTCFDMFRYSMI